MNRNKKALLIGLILGDGHLNPRSGVSLEIMHSDKQKFYLEYKNKLISEILNCKLCNLYHRKSTNCYKLAKGHRYFKILYKWIYKNGVKRFSKKLLSYLTPESIALWWMDDGTHAVECCHTPGVISAHKFCLYTFTNKEDTQNIIDFFADTYNIHFYPIKKRLKNGDEAFYIQCRTREGRKLSNLLRPYIIPGMEYKIMRKEEC